MALAADRHPDLEHSSAEEVLAYAATCFHPRLAVACSFQKEATVIMDMMLAVEPRARFFVLDTGLLFPETHSTWRALEQRYGIEIEVFRGISLAEQANRHGDALWERDPDRCCDIRRVTPLHQALSGVDAWVTGLRRAQSPERADTPKLGWDEKHGLWKASPLAGWSEADVWNYIAERDLPYNELHDRGYESIGCTHCTRPAAGRDGRWANFEKRECGLH